MTADKNRIFLEDIGEIVMSRGGKDIWLVKGITQHETFQDRCLPEKIYVVDFPGRGLGEELLLSRQACGAEKFLMIKEIGHDMIRLFERMFDGKVAQFVILWGGRPLDLLDANPPLQRSRLLDTTYIKLTRVEDDAAFRGWHILESSFVGEWWQDETWIIMEECIASGQTLTYFVDEALQHHKPKKIFLFPVCASLEGLEGICRICKEHRVELGTKGKSNFRIILGNPSRRFFAGQKSITHDQVKSSLRIFPKNLFKIGCSYFFGELIFDIAHLLLRFQTGLMDHAIPWFLNRGLKDGSNFKRFRVTCTKSK